MIGSGRRQEPRRSAGLRAQQNGSRHPKRHSQSTRLGALRRLPIQARHFADASPHGARPIQTTEPLGGARRRAPGSATPVRRQPNFCFFFPSATPKDRLKRTASRFGPVVSRMQASDARGRQNRKAKLAWEPRGMTLFFWGERKKLSRSVDIQKRHKITTLDSAPTALLRRLARSQSRRVKCRFESFSSD